MLNETGKARHMMGDGGFLFDCSRLVQQKFDSPAAIILDILTSLFELLQWVNVIAHSIFQTADLLFSIFLRLTVLRNALSARHLEMTSDDFQVKSSSHI
jgi:hypothetical protein